MKNLKDRTFVGIVEDNKDPERKGRCKVRIYTVFEPDIPTASLPWASPFKDLNGNEFVPPEVGKVVSVIFSNGDKYKPEFIYAYHYNINLENKLKDLSEQGYLSMRNLMFDHKTQIYSNDDEGLMIDYKLNNINVLNNSINVNLKDNFGSLNLGDATAGQQAILGNNFLDWFDEFVQNLLGSSGGPYLGNLGQPVVANPDFIECLTKYQALKNPKFLSHNVNIVDNGQVSKKERPIDSQLGDSWKSTVASNNLSKEPVDFRPRDGIKQDVDDPNYKAPSTDGQPDAIIPTGGTFSNPALSDTKSNPDIDKMIRYMKSKGYTVYTEKFKLNIVGFRNKDNGSVSNVFDEYINVFYLNENNAWVNRSYKATTVPGFRPGSSTLPNKVAVLQLGQYVEQYQIGYHQNRTGKIGGAVDSNGNLYPEHKCLKLATTIVLRNTDSGNYNFSSPTQTGSFGINIHHAGDPQSEKTFNWSEGCQVFKQKAAHDEFMKLCENQVKQTGKTTFTYTLVKKSEYDSFS